jgi:hypothetical protein
LVRFGFLTLAAALVLGRPARSAEIRLDAAALARRIDQEIQKQLDTRQVPASGLADDAEFLRRVYLDMHGAVPPTDRVVAFLDSKAPDKRARLIDELLASPRYGVRLADVWDEMLVRPKPGDDLRRYSRIELTRWLEDSFNRNRPWNEIAYDLITASGTRAQNPAMIYLSNGGLKQQLNAADATGSVSRLFLGVQLQCAECHNHPFTGWKKTDFWALAAFFGKMQRVGYHELTEQGKPNKVPPLPEHAPKESPRFLGGETPTLAPTAPYRPALARWVTSPENPYFARAMVNRTWAHYFGRGLVNPVDDLRPDNPASHPELFELLTGQFVASSFDLTYLARAITNSQAYQRTSLPTPANREDHASYSRMTIKVLSGEQLYDSLVVVLGEPPSKFAGQEKRGPRPSFAAFFNPEDVDVDPTEYTRGIPQLLRSMNSAEFSKNAEAAVAQVVRQHPSAEARVEALYLRALARRPNPAEKGRLLAFVRQQGDDAPTYGQLLWVLLNTSEFSLNR